MPLRAELFLLLLPGDDDDEKGEEAEGVVRGRPLVYPSEVTRLAVAKATLLRRPVRGAKGEVVELVAYAVPFAETALAVGGEGEGEPDGSAQKLPASSGIRPSRRRWVTGETEAAEAVMTPAWSLDDMVRECEPLELELDGESFEKLETTRAAMACLRQVFSSCPPQESSGCAAFVY